MKIDNLRNQVKRDLTCITNGSDGKLIKNFNRIYCKEKYAKHGTSSTILKCT